jgi:uncharacterized RDD family membrane protein YckC
VEYSVPLAGAADCIDAAEGSTGLVPRSAIASAEPQAQASDLAAWTAAQPASFAQPLWPEERHVERIEVQLAEADRSERLMLPTPVADSARKLSAAVIDGLGVGVASALFCGICAQFLSRPTVIDRAFLLHRFAPAAIVVPGLLAAIYILLSFYLCGRTLGMKAMKLEVTSFTGSPVSARHLRLRAWASLLSLGAVGLGYWWMLVDDDRLTWHDHLSRTYVTSQRCS